MATDKIDELYDALKADGLVQKDRNNFRDYMLAPGKQGYKNRLELYNALKEDEIISSPTYEEFAGRLGLGPVHPATQPGPQAGQQPVVQTQLKTQPQGAVTHPVASPASAVTTTPASATPEPIQVPTPRTAAQQAVPAPAQPAQPVQAGTPAGQPGQVLGQDGEPLSDGMHNDGRYIRLLDGRVMERDEALELYKDNKITAKDIYYTQQDSAEYERNKKAVEKKAQKEYEEFVRRNSQFVTLKNGQKMTVGEYDDMVTLKPEFANNLDYDPRQAEEETRREIEAAQQAYLVRTKGTSVDVTEVRSGDLERRPGETDIEYEERMRLMPKFKWRELDNHGNEIGTLRYHQLADPEDVLRVTGKADRAGSSLQPFALRDVTVTGDTALAVAKKEENAMKAGKEWLLTHPDTGKYYYDMLAGSSGLFGGDKTVSYEEWVNGLDGDTLQMVLLHGEDPEERGSNYSTRQESLAMQLKLRRRAADFVRSVRREKAASAAGRYGYGIAGAVYDFMYNPLGVRDLYETMFYDRPVVEKLKKGEKVSQEDLDVFLTRLAMDDVRASFEHSGEYEAGEFTGAMAEMTAEFGVAPKLAARFISKASSKIGVQGVRELIRNTPGLLDRIKLISKTVGLAAADAAILSVTTQLPKNITEAYRRTYEASKAFDDEGNSPVEVKDSGTGIGTAAAQTMAKSVATDMVFLAHTKVGERLLAKVPALKNALTTVFKNNPVNDPLDGFIKITGSEVIGSIMGEISGRPDIDGDFETLTHGGDFGAMMADRGNLAVNLVLTEFLTGGVPRAARRVMSRDGVIKRQQQTLDEYNAARQRAREALEGADVPEELRTFVDRMDSMDPETAQREFASIMARMTADARPVARPVEPEQMAIADNASGRKRRALRSQQERERARYEAEKKAWDEYALPMEALNTVGDALAARARMEGARMASDAFFGTESPHDERLDRIDALRKEGAASAITPERAEERGMRYNLAYERAVVETRDLLGLTPDTDVLEALSAHLGVSNDPQVMYMSMDRFRGNDTQREAATTLLEECMRYEGTLDARREEARKTASEEMTAMRPMMHLDTDEVVQIVDNDGRILYLSSGDIVSDRNGRIDTAASDSSVFVHNPETGETEQMSLDRIDRVASRETPSQVYNGIVKREMDDFMDAMLGRVDAPEPGMQVQLLDSQRGLATFNILSVDENGVWLEAADGSYRQMLSAEEYTDAVREVRYEEFKTREAEREQAEQDGRAQEVSEEGQETYAEPETDTPAPMDDAMRPGPEERPEERGAAMPDTDTRLETTPQDAPLNAGDTFIVLDSNVIAMTAYVGERTDGRVVLHTYDPLNERSVRQDGDYWTTELTPEEARGYMCLDEAGNVVNYHSETPVDTSAPAPEAPAPESNREPRVYGVGEDVTLRVGDTDVTVPAEPVPSAPISIKYDQGDSFRVSVSGREETQQAAVVDREGETVTIWTPFPVTDMSEKGRTMAGYTTDIARADLDAIVVRDEQGKPVDYVAANPEVEENMEGEHVVFENNSVNLQHGNGSGQDNDERTEPREADGGRMASDAAGTVEADRDRSDIRVYEEGLASSRDAHSGDSERNRREAESERLVSIAKTNGQYFDRDRKQEFGEKQLKATGESEVFIDRASDKVYKVKDPYAKSPMKGNVQPEDAIYEHLVHNKYFPETRYRFEGISEDLGEARIVLSQGYIESVGRPTQEQIEAALAEKGLYPDGKYTYGNEEVSVTDVTGDNALLGIDGKVYFIDPIINFKKPVRDIIGEYAQASNQSETVPNSGETPQNPTENAVSLAESVPNPVAPVENVQETPAPTAEQTPLQRLPRDAKGEPVFEQAENPEHGWDALVEFAEGDAATAKEIADTMAEEKRKAYEKAQKQKPKGKTPAEILASKKAISAGLAQAEQEYNLWQHMANVEQRRQDAIRSQQEAEARQRAAERAEAERKRKAAEQEAGTPAQPYLRERENKEGVRDWKQDNPADARARGYWMVDGRKVERQPELPMPSGVRIAVKFDRKNVVGGVNTVIEAEQLQPSHLDGTWNPRFMLPEGQPKKEFNGARVVSAERIATEITPAEITGGVTAYTGAPVVNRRGESIQGTGRGNALRIMWERYPDQAAAYKAYLLDLAQEGKIDKTPEEIESMKAPVNVRMLDVDDAEAIRLGNISVDNTESGGRKRMEPQATVSALGATRKTGEFIRRLFEGTDEEMSLVECIRERGYDVIKWLQDIGVINETQFETAVTNQKNREVELTDEAVADMRSMVEQTFFGGGPEGLREQWRALPDKAQKAILATSYKDMSSPEDSRIIGELHRSVAAYSELSAYPAFQEARNAKEVLRAVEGWASSMSITEDGGMLQNREKYSNLALHLAALYKGETQKAIRDHFNRLYELIQGTHTLGLEDMMEGKTEADYAPRTLSEAVKEVFGIEYKPTKQIRHEKDSEQNRRVPLAGGSETGPRGSGMGPGGVATGERGESGRGNTERRGGASGDGGGRGERGNLQPFEKRPESAASEIDENGLPFVISENGTTSFGVIREESGLPGAPIKLSEGYQDENGKGYGLRHIEAGHGDEIRNAGFTTVKEFVSFVAENYDEDNIRVGKQRRNGNTTYLIQVTDSHDNTLFIELSRDGSYWNVNSGGVFRKGYSKKKETVAKTEPQQPNNAVSSDSSLPTDEQRGTSSIEPNGESTVSGGKGNTLPSEKQGDGGKSSGVGAAEAGSRDQDGSESWLSAGGVREGNRKVYEAGKSLLESAGIEVVEVSDAEAREKLDSRTGDEKLMGSRTDRKMDKIAEHYRGKELDENQQAAVDVFSGKRDNVAIEVERADGRKRVVMRQGKEPKAGAKHSLFRHFDTESNYVTADDIAMIPVIIAKGERTVSGNKIAYEYNTEDGVKLKVTTEIHGKSERFTNFLSNKKPRQKKRAENTQLSAPRSDAEVSEAKLNKKFQIGNPEAKESSAELTQAELQELDARYMEAVERGDKEKAQAMVNEAAERAGYSSDSDYQGTSAFNGAAPFNTYGWSKEERRRLWDEGDFEGAWTLGDQIDGMDNGDLEFRMYDPRGLRSLSAAGRESAQALREAYRNPERKIKVYRSVPSDVKEGSLRDGDWVTPSRTYAKENAAVHDWGRKYRIIEEEVDVDELWWDGNDINEWGYDGGRNMGYRNTRNNRKLLDAVTYDDQGNVIPLSQRFNSRKSDVRYLKTPQGVVYGWTQDGKVYLNRDAVNPETPLHEYTHLWDDMVRRQNPELWTRGVELMKQTPVWKEVLDDSYYADIRHDEDAVASEVHSRLTGRDGARLMEEMVGRARREGVVETAKALTLVERLRHWLGEMFMGLKKTLGKWSGRDLRNLTVDDFAGLTLRDLAHGLNPRHEDRQRALREAEVRVVDVPRHDFAGRLEHQRMLDTARRVAESLGEKVVLYEAPGDIHDSDYNRQVRKQRSYGWYNPNDGTIHINVGRHRSAHEIVKTVLHEIVGHKTIEQIMGPERFARLIDEIWNHAGKKVRGKIAEKMRKNGWDFRKATKEYLGEIAEEVRTKGFETLETEKRTIWQRMKAKIQDFLNRILEGMKIPARVRLTENDLSYMMWKLYNHKERKAAGKPAEGDIFDKAEDIARREQWEREDESLEIAAREGGDNKTMAERAREVMEQVAIEIAPHDYSREELKRLYSTLPSVEKDGRQVHFYHSAFGKNYRPDGNFAKVIPQLDQLLEAAKFAYSTADELGGHERRDGSMHKAHPNLDSYDNYVAKAKIGEDEYYVRITVQNEQRGSRSGVHSSMVTNVALYENPAALNSLPIIHGGAVNYDRITDTKLREFFESAKRNPDYVKDLLPSDMENANTEYRVRENQARGFDPETGLHFRDGDEESGGKQGKADFSRELENHAVETAERFGEGVVVHRTREEITHEDAEFQERMRGSKGWYDPETGEVHVNLEAHADAADVVRTVMHEAVGHKGLRAIVGEENMEGFLDTVYRQADTGVRTAIARRAARNGWNQRLATEEYLAELAETVNERGFENLDMEQKRFWTKVKERVEGFMNSILHGLGVKKSVRLSDKDLAYMMWQVSRETARRAGAKSDIVERARDAARLHEFRSDPESLRFRQDSQSGRRGWQTYLDTLDRINDTLTDHATTLADREAAKRNLGKVTGNIIRAMQIQRRYDHDTVDAVKRLYDTLRGAGLLENMNASEVNSALAIMRAAVSQDELTGATQRVMSVVSKNQLRQAGNALESILKIKGVRTNVHGGAQGAKLDPQGARMHDAFKRFHTSDETTIDNRISTVDERIDRLAPNGVVAPENQIAYDESQAERMGLRLAQRYSTESKLIKNDLATLDAELDDLTSTYDRHWNAQQRSLYAQQKRAIKEAIIRKTAELADLTYDIAGALAGEIGESKTRMQEWRDREKQRLDEIHHDANSDLQGRKQVPHKGLTGFIPNLTNFGPFRWLMNPAATFEQLIREITVTRADGEGRMYDRFVRGWMECRDNEWMNLRQTEATMDAKAGEMLLKRRGKWNDLYKLSREKAGTLTWKEGNEDVMHDVTQGNLMYVYMVDKMADGRMKLRAMGIDENTMDNVEAALDPTLRTVADWIQEEFLPSLRDRYNQTHQRLFGASMDEIDNYFPLRILKTGRDEKVEIGNEGGNKKPKTMTGATTRRVVNNRPLDILRSDAVSVCLEHVREMEEWNAFAEYRQNLGDLLSYSPFANKVRNMKSIYGSGEKLWEQFETLAHITGGCFEPKVGEVDRMVINSTKLVTGACIAMRIVTALKQFLSYPAFLGEGNTGRLLLNMNPYHATKCVRWAMKNLPNFNRRWNSRQAGNDVLRKWDGDWDWTNSDIVQKIQRVGITPNAFVDIVTVAMGADAVYRSKMKQYLSEGMSQEDAHRKAVLDSEIVFNLSQQSSEAPFMSRMQSERSFLNTVFVNFRNSPMSYLRQSIQSKRELLRMLSNREMRQQKEVNEIMANGVDERTARKLVGKRWNRAVVKNIMKSMSFDYILPSLWALGGSAIWYLLFGDDEEKKRELVKDAFERGLFGIMEGFPGGGTVPDAAYSLMFGKDYQIKETTLVGVPQLFEPINKLLAGKKTEALNSAINVAFSLGTGVNPKVLEDVIVAGLDTFGTDERTTKDYIRFALNVLQAPQSQIDLLYMDELGMSGKEAARKSPAELAERYATYKARRANFATMWAYDDNRWETEIKGSWRKKFEKEARTRLKGQSEDRINESLEGYDAEWSQTDKRLKALSDTPGDAAKERAIFDSPEGARYKLYNDMHPYLDQMIKSWLSAPTAQQAATEATAIIEYKAKLVEMLDAWDNPEKSRGARREAMSIVREWHNRQNTNK